MDIENSPSKEQKQEAVKDMSPPFKFEKCIRYI